MVLSLPNRNLVCKGEGGYSDYQSLKYVRFIFDFFPKKYLIFLLHSSNLGCRETAFVYGLTSAGLTFEMIRACSEGRIAGCPKRCTAEKVNLQETRLLNATHSLNEACNDNLRFGFKTWYSVVFQGERYSDMRAVFNVKNSIVGFKVNGTL